jgi:hypothetical protein
VIGVKPDPELMFEPAPEPSLLLANPAGVVSSALGTVANLELSVFGVLDLVKAVALGAGLGVKRGVPIWLFDSELFPNVPREGPRPGVGCSTGLFLYGDSGRGRDGLAFGLNWGLGGRAPGPTDCENFGIAWGGEAELPSIPPKNEGVVGVGGNVSADGDGEARLAARWIGRNMPEPGIDVVK